MKNVMFLLVVSIVLSCQKDVVEPATPLDANNKFDATITHLPSGEVIEFSTKGSDVELGCGWVGSYVTAKQSPGAIYLSYINDKGQCITGPGIYSSICNYYPNEKSQTSPQYYGSWQMNKQGSITYTVFNEKYMEGYFNATCKYSSTDSVLVKGTFSGNRKW